MNVSPDIVEQLKAEVDRVVLMTSNYWHGMEYQRHHLARRFAAAGVEVVFIERTPQRWPHFGLKDFREWYRRSGQGSDKSRRPIPDRLQVKNIRLLPPAAWLRPLNRSLIRKAFAKSSQADASGARTWFITYVPTYNALDVIEQVKPGKIVYVNVHNYDDDVDFVMGALLKAERKLIVRSDRLLADSQHNIERLKRLSGDRPVAASLPGVNFAAFRRAFRGDEAREAKTIFYFGSIKRDLNMPLYNALAEKRKVVFVGKIAAGIAETMSPKIEVRPPVANERLPDALREADMLALLYKRIDYNRGIFPAKLFECLATKKPLVADGLPDAELYGEAIYRFDGSEEQLWQVVENLPNSETEERIRARENLARDADWDRRFETFVANLLDEQ